jgi:hypothetical protein
MICLDQRAQKYFFSNYSIHTPLRKNGKYEELEKIKIARSMEEINVGDDTCNSNPSI